MAQAVEIAQTFPTALAGGVLVSLVGLFIRSMLQSNDAAYRLATERLTDLESLRHEVELLREEVKQQRQAKHDAVNAQQAAELLVASIWGLAEQCSCGALDKVREIIDRRK